jgi:hypothetical protein
VYSHGGRKNVGLDAVAWAKQMAEHGAGEILLTSMDRDGTKSGFDLELTRAVSDAVGVPVIASGGVGNLDHLADGVQQGGADAVLAASIFHYGEFTVGLFGKLPRLVKESYIFTHLHYRPTLARFTDGLIALTAGGEGTLARLFAEDQPARALAYTERLAALVGDRLYVEISRRGNEVEERAEAGLSA